MREKKQRKPSRQNTVKNKQHTRKNFREETTELIDENFVFGYHAVIEALKEGRGNKLFMAEDARGEKIDGLKKLLVHSLSQSSGCQNKSSIK